MTIPIWVYAVVVGIVISALMAIKTGREERLLEMENIEKEGEIYLTRLEKKKKDAKEIELQQNKKTEGTHLVPSVFFVYLIYCVLQLLVVQVRLLSLYHLFLLLHL